MTSDQNFIIENEGLVYKVWNDHFSRKYYHLKEDLLQEGRIALHKANGMFDENKGYSFSTYAYKAIWNTMRNYLLSKERIQHEKPISLEATIPGVKSENITFGDSIHDPEAEEILENVIDKTAHGTFIAKITSFLPLETQMLIFRVYGIGCRPHTLKELAKEEGITPQALGARIQRALNAIRERYAGEWEAMNQ